jgi:hypothetical protein
MSVYDNRKSCNDNYPLLEQYNGEKVQYFAEKHSEARILPTCLSLLMVIPTTSLSPNAALQINF